MSNKSVFSGDDNFEYEGKDLESMSYAPNYNNWILDCFDRYIGKLILEVGAGSGVLSELIINRYQKETYLLEPSPAMFKIQKDLITKNFKDIDQDQLINGVLKDNYGFFETKKLDTIFYINVLEHTQDDIGELKLAYKLLEKNGHVLTFSPALPQLYGNIDKQVGHYRRYYLKEMKQKMQAAGFSVVESYYFDFVGMILWWIKFKLFNSKNQDKGSVKLFDSVLVPILKKIEIHKLLPIGKNIIVIGKK